MENKHDSDGGTITPNIESEEDLYGWSFHKWPFLIALAITVLLYLMVITFVDPNPPYFDPSELPPPPAGG